MQLSLVGILDLEERNLLNRHGLTSHRFGCRLDNRRGDGIEKRPNSSASSSKALSFPTVAAITTKQQLIADHLSQKLFLDLFQSFRQVATCSVQDTCGPRGSSSKAEDKHWLGLGHHSMALSLGIVGGHTVSLLLRLLILRVAIVNAWEVAHG